LITQKDLCLFRLLTFISITLLNKTNIIIGGIRGMSSDQKKIYFTGWLDIFLSEVKNVLFKK